MEMVSITSGIVHFYFPLFVHLNSIIYIGKIGESYLFDYSRKLAYVGIRIYEHNLSQWENLAGSNYCLGYWEISNNGNSI